MAVKRLTLGYSIAAVVIALAIIGTSLYVNPMTVNARTNFVVMLTDPPKVPDGTTKLEVTYSHIQLHVVASDGTANWVDADQSDTVDLLSLVEVEQTIASLILDTGSIVDKLQFTISSAKATINGVEHSVTILNNQLIITLRGIKLTGTTTGALIDLRPVLHEIKAIDANGDPVTYYVLVPSATAVVKKNVSEEHKKVGAKHDLTDEEEEELEDEFEKSSKEVTISEPSLVVHGDEITLSIKFTNTGTRNVVINGLTIHGDFSFSKPTPSSSKSGSSDDHPCTITFKVTPDALVLRMGDRNDHDETNKGLELEPNDSTTIAFSGPIQIQLNEHSKANPITITPRVGNEYTIRVSGEGSQTIPVTATPFTP